jgi:hypothetical protein
MSLVATRRCTGIDVPTSETDSYLSPPPFLFPLPQQPSLKGGGGGGGLKAGRREGEMLASLLLGLVEGSLYDCYVLRSISFLSNKSKRL